MMCMVQSGFQKRISTLEKWPSFSYRQENFCCPPVNLKTNKGVTLFFVKRESEGEREKSKSANNRITKCLDINKLKYQYYNINSPDNPATVISPL